MAEGRNRQRRADGGGGKGAWHTPGAVAGRWGRGYREQPGRSVCGVAAPAWVSRLTLLAGLGMAALLWLVSLW